MLLFNYIKSKSILGCQTLGGLFMIDNEQSQILCSDK